MCLMKIMLVHVLKLRDNGLNAIVLLGELGDLEDKILDLELRIEAESNRNIELKKTADEYKDRDSKNLQATVDFRLTLDCPGMDIELNEKRLLITVSAMLGLRIK